MNAAGRKSCANKVGRRENYNSVTFRCCCKRCLVFIGEKRTVQQRQKEQGPLPEYHVCFVMRPTLVGTMFVSL